MAANLQNWKDAMETAITGITATVDGSGLSYRFIDSLTEERGHGQHRELLWRAARSGEIIGETPIEIEWTVPLELYIHRRDRTYEAFATAYEDEAADVVVAWSGRDAIGTDVREGNLDRFQTEEIDPEPMTRAAGIPRYEVAKVTFIFRVVTGEA